MPRLALFCGTFYSSSTRSIPGPKSSTVSAPNHLAVSTSVASNGNFAVRSVPVRSNPGYQQFPTLRAIGFSFTSSKMNRMKSSPRGFRQAIRTAILLGTISAAALANQVPALRSGLRRRCATAIARTRPAMKHCTKMCELPQFQNRWWAISCHKKNSTANESSSPASNPGSKKTNRKEQAQPVEPLGQRSRASASPPNFRALNFPLSFTACKIICASSDESIVGWNRSESSMARARSIFASNVR